MKIRNAIKGLVPVLTGLFVGAVMSGHAYAIPYTGDSTPATPNPAFNVYTGVPSEGNESDFFRGKVEGDTNPSVDAVKSTCETGKRFTLRVYVHNGADQAKNDNGNGPSVAKDVKVKVDLKNGAAASSFNPNATISASNAASVSDGMSITCTDGKTVNLNYVTGTAKQFTRTGTRAISDELVKGGAAVGTDTNDGNVWGCWEQRVYVTFTVEVKEVPKEVPSNAICVVDDKAFKVDDRKVTITVDARTENATKTGKYEINWGDGSAVSAKQTDSHTYAKDGTYTIKARVEVKLANGKTMWVEGESCTRQVTFKPGQPPVTPPVVTPSNGKLANTGPGDVAGIFTGVSAFGAAAHSLISRRRRQ